MTVKYGIQIGAWRDIYYGHAQPERSQMPKGVSAPVGSETIAQNGYTWVKTENGWKYKHHLVAENTLGRPLLPTERATFADGNRTNFDPDNIVVEVSQRRRNRVFLLETKVDKMLTELEDMKREIEALKENESSE